MTRPLLDIRRLHKRFGPVEVLAGVSLAVGEGEFVSILGPSGSGKSTLFRILTGAVLPEGGGASLSGAPLGKPAGHFAFMPQRDALMPWRRVIDNAALALEIGGMRRDEARRRLQPLLEEFGLAGFENHYPDQLSGGMRQRVALLRTVVQEARMLLLDEPFGALDALTRTAMQAWLQRMWQNHRWTALLITHDVREAVFLSDRIYVLTPRPARIAAEHTVPLPRPRRLEHLASPEARRLESELLDTLLGARNPTVPQPKENAA